MRIGATALLLVPVAALAASALDGTWRARIESVQVSGKPDVFAVVDGTYTCSSCDPPISVRADGLDHPVKGHDYYDSIALKVRDERTLERTIKQKGKVAGSGIVTVSADGARLTGTFTDYTGAKPASGSYTAKRVAAGPPGSHAASGSWQQDKMQSGNDALLTVTYAMSSDSFSMSANGQSYHARFDGKEYRVQGDPGHTTVSLKKLDERTVIETDRRAGRVTDEVRIHATEDGKSIELTDLDRVRGQTAKLILDKQ